MKKKTGNETCESCGRPDRLTAEILRRRMQERDLNASQLARLVDTDRHTISRLLNEQWNVKNIKYGLALAIIDALYT